MLLFSKGLFTLALTACLMGALCSAFSPASDAKTPKPTNQLDLFPETEQQAKAEYIKILREMEYRSARAAKMAYVHSNEFEKIHMNMTYAVCIVTLIATLILQVPVECRMSRYLSVGLWSLSAAAAAWISFYQNFERILPLYHCKHVAYNEAGAQWQALEFKIRFEIATSLQKNVSLEDLRKKGYYFADERRKICEIARPTVESHDKYEKDYYVIKRNKAKLMKAVAEYFAEVNGSTAPTDCNVETKKTVATPKE